MSDATNATDKGFQDFTVWGTVGAMGVTIIDFRSVWEGDKLVVDCDPAFPCNRTEERDGDRVTVHVGGWAYPNLVPDIGIQPGVNSLLFAVPYEDLPPRFEALHIFADSFVEVTTEPSY